ncbi:hypothetical protein A6769_22040 [Nostoc punctiforme NIES-2108]|uniref:KGK domain-containing protein n=1 Tax=Nostoc punctiforme NIES-2108 TaxID=1356359 RepID=A0A367RH36_NOSPU|nr:hypothetical protein A6769_22040 [Nostoc punctiforme NIES-2108]
MSDEIDLDDDDVVSLGHADYSISNTATSTVGEIKKSLLKTWLTGYLQGWISGGMACRVLSVHGGGWRAGKILLRLEFIPNEPKIPERKTSMATTEPVSPLDDLRSQLNPE